MTMTRTPCAVLMDFMPVWRILAFVFCCTRLMGFSRIPTCSSRCCRAKLWMLGRVGREWRSSATPSSESGSGSKRSTRQPRASPPPQALKETLAHITPQKSSGQCYLPDTEQVPGPGQINLPLPPRPPAVPRLPEKSPADGLLQPRAELRDVV